MASRTALPFAAIGARIRAARNRAGLSQEAFAGRINTSRRHVMRLERGQHKPSEGMVARIAEVTGAPVREILGDEDDEDSERVTLLVPIDIELLARAVERYQTSRRQGKTLA